MPSKIGTPVLEASVEGTTATLSWTQPRLDPSEYEVLRGGNVIDTLDNALRSYVNTGLLAGKVYCYQIRGFKGTNEELSNKVCVDTPAAAPTLTAPSLTVTSGSAQATLSWPAVSNADSYTVQRKTGAGSYADVQTQTGLTWTNTGLTNGSTYTYRVRGTSNSGTNTGPWSNEVAAAPTAALTVAPTLTGTAGDNNNSLDWNSVANAVTYRLRVSVNGGPLIVFPDTTATDLVDDTATNGNSYEYTVRGINSDGALGAVSSPATLSPEAAVPAGFSAFVGYAGVAGVTGGAGGTVFSVSTWAALKTALLASGPRVINMTGNAVIDGNGDSFSVSNPNITWDGTGWTGVLKNYKILFRCSNVILTQLALRPGEGATGSASSDRRAISFNPPSGEGISRIVVDHCSLAWGPDVVFSAINQTTDVTIQHCILGPALQGSNDPDHGADQSKGYGPNITVPAGGDPLLYPARITYYRNLMIMNNKRNFRGHGIDGWDVVNNVLYDWGSKSGHGNPRGANVINNVYKKGPQTTNAEAWDSEVFGVYTTYFTNSVYLSGNIGRAADGATLALTQSYAAGVSRTTAYDGGPTAANHGPLVVATANDAMFTDVVAAAGRTYQDDIDTALKAHAMAGTDEGDFYQGAGFGPPHPSWTAGA